MKNKKGFTLIELLAIIVILAIIAVITVPIILNIIENAKKGAATDSAYGYKDAINKYFVNELAKNSSYDDLDGEYIVNSDGYLVENNVVKHQIQMSGQKPTTGAIIIENNIVTKACLQFGEYAVAIEDNKVTITIKGTCDGTNLSSPQSSNQLSIDDFEIGDRVLLGTKQNYEGFYIINTNKDGKVLLMTEYSLVNDGTGLNPLWVQGDESVYDTVLFSDDLYWLGETSHEQNESSYILSDFGSDYLIQWTGDCTYSCSHYIFRDKNGNDAPNNLIPAINSYKDYMINTLEVNVYDARAMKIDEFLDLDVYIWGDKVSIYSDILGETEFWLGSSSEEITEGIAFAGNYTNQNGINHNVGAASCGTQQQVDTTDCKSHSYRPVETYAIRPVIEISTSEFLNKLIIPVATPTE